jgi:aspartate/methionine/tyrosine aminotransferase
MTTLALDNISTASATPAARAWSLELEGAFEVLARARALERRGRDIAHLAIGEPDFATPAHIVEAGARALRDGDTRYAPPAGIPALREAIAASLRDREVLAEPEQVVVTPGAKAALCCTILCAISPGDEVLVPDPGFPAYRSLVRFAGGCPVSYGLNRGADFAPDVDEIAARITPRTRALILNAPHNPTGSSVTPDLLIRIAQLAARHDLLVISDEIYGRLVYDARLTRAPSIAALPEMTARTVIIDGLSKTYAMTGWRLGFAVLPPALAERVIAMVVNAYSCVPPFVQRAGLAAITGPQECVREMVATLRRRRALLLDDMIDIPGIRCRPPAGAFYLYADVGTLLTRTGLTTDGLAARLLDDAGVATLPGTAFGQRGDGYLRLSFAAGERDLVEGARRIRACVEALDANWEKLS